MSDPYAEVKAHFSNVEGVTVNAGQGAQGLKIGNKMFVMFHKGQLRCIWFVDRFFRGPASGRPGAGP